MASSSLVLLMDMESLPKACVHHLTFSYISSGSSSLISPRFFNLYNVQKSFKVILISIAKLACVWLLFSMNLYSPVQMNYLSLPSFHPGVALVLESKLNDEGNRAQETGHISSVGMFAICFMMQCSELYFFAQYINMFYLHGKFLIAC